MRAIQMSFQNSSTLTYVRSANETLAPNLKMPLSIYPVVTWRWGSAQDTWHVKDIHPVPPREHSNTWTQLTLYRWLPSSPLKSICLRWRNKVPKVLLHFRLYMPNGAHLDSGKSALTFPYVIRYNKRTYKIRAMNGSSPKWLALVKFVINRCYRWTHNQESDAC